MPMTESLNIEIEKHIPHDFWALSGFLPVCAGCKKIRDNKGLWNHVECYIGDFSKAKLTHSICPECARKLYPEFNPYDDE